MKLILPEGVKAPSPTKLVLPRGSFPPKSSLGWPHPGRPGLPHNYHKEGYFAIRRGERTFALRWDPVEEVWDSGFTQYSPSVVAKSQYLGAASLVFRSLP